MKIFVIVAVVAFGAALQIVSVAGSLETQLGTVNAQIDVVETLLTQLRERQYVSRIAKAVDTITNMRLNASLIMDPYCERPLDNIQDAINISKAGGKNPDNCYATAMSDHETIRINTENQIEECNRIMHGLLNTTADTLQSKVQEGLQILSFLNKIFPTCYTTDTEVIESCIVAILPDARVMVEAYRTSANLFITSIIPNETADQQITTCFGKAGDIGDEGCDAMESKFNACIAAL